MISDPVNFHDQLRDCLLLRMTSVDVVSSNGGIHERQGNHADCQAAKRRQGSYCLLPELVCNQGEPMAWEKVDGRTSQKRSERPTLGTE